MKRYLSILSALLFVFTFHYGAANTYTTKPDKNQEQEQDQEGRRKSDQTLIRPDGQFQGSTETIEAQESERQSNSESSKQINPSEKVDSLQDDSVSKYNFIFYFLYKFKYEEESP